MAAKWETNCFDFVFLEGRDARGPKASRHTLKVKLFPST